MVTRKKTEAVTPPALIERVLKAAGDQVVLVGGQALAFWVRRYNLALPAGVATVSADMDFLARSPGDMDTVKRFARAIHGHVLVPNRRALTALVGQVVLDVSDDEYINIDVIHDLIGIEPDAVRKRAVRVEQGDTVYRVMHPLDVLHSRVANLHKILDKAERLQEKRRMQLALGIDVAREFQRAVAAEAPARALATGRSPIQHYVSMIERLAVEDAGRKVAARHGLHVADAIDPLFIPAGPFWELRWPTLKALMSTKYAAQFKAPPKTK